MFNKWDGEGGYKALFEGAEGRGKGGREAAPAVEDREEERRVPGVGLQRTAAQGEASQEQQQQSSQNEARRMVELSAEHGLHSESRPMNYLKHQNYDFDRCAA